ncbi:MAG: sn-glycerol-1-phosphate dehydrogenase [Clostridia bacterium]|nr:sn-glycerol-1-phosphate dehydrogenase [Clostridia bacterium]
MHLAEMPIGELAGVKYKCSCNRTHSVDIDLIDISENANENAIRYLADKYPGKKTLICDDNTYRAAGKQIEDGLANAGQVPAVHVVQGRNGLAIAPDDAAIGSVLARIERGTDHFIAVGSGVINDITRQISYKTGAGYTVVATAPSMDGYASVTSSLIINNVKESIQGQYPRAIFGQTDVLKNAPYEMLTAGFGDVVGKYNALREWRFGRDLNGEHYCAEIAKLVEKAVAKCRQSSGGLKKRDEKAVVNTMEALVLAGMAMGLYGGTRPASGAEHHMVHYWDVDCIRRGVEHELHGNSVGIGTVVICRLFDMVRDRLPVEVDYIDADEIELILKDAGCKTSPVEAGIDRDLFKRSIMYGNTMSSKFTVLEYLARKNPRLLEETAGNLCDLYY